MKIRILSSILLALPAACSVTLFRDCRWTQVHSFQTEPKSEARRIALECPSSDGAVRAHFRIEGCGGDLSLRLFDPAGTERHRQEVHGGTCDVTQLWPARRGAWIVDLVATEFAGGYAVELCSGACAIDGGEAQGPR